MKKTPVVSIFSVLLAAPLLSFAQAEAPKTEGESTVVEAVADATVQAATATADAVVDAAGAVAAATAEVTESIYDGVISVFDRASKRDAWDIRLSVFAKYGDNRDSVPDGYDTHHDGDRYGYVKEEDIVLGVQPSATFTGNFARKSVYKIGYSPVFQYWTNPRVGDLRKELSHAAVLEYRYILDRRNEITIRDDFKYIQNDYWYLGSGEVENYQYINRRRVEHEQAHIDNTLNLFWRTQLTERTAFTLKGYWLAIRYEDDELATIEDEDKYVLSADLFRSYNSHISYGLFGQYQRWDDSGKDWLRSEPQERRVERGISTYTLGFSGVYRATTRLTVNARYGWEWIDYDDESITDRDFPGDGEISATYAFTLRAKGTLGFRYGVTEAWVYPYASQDLYSFYSYLRTRHTKRFYSTLRFDYKLEKFDSKYIPNGLRDANYRTREGDKKDLYGEFSLGYRWSKNLDIIAHYSYEEVDSEVSTSYHENTLGIRATYLF